jgi:hypothetical protein|nr:MAG TPA: hypothetical protein [Caudoviricetes sp.]
MAVGAILGQKPRIPQPVDSVQQGNMNAVTSNAVYEAIQAIPEPSGGKWELAQKKENYSEWHMVVEGGTFVKLTANTNFGFSEINNVAPNSFKYSNNITNITGILLPPPAFWMGGTILGKVIVNTDEKSLVISKISIGIGENYATMHATAWNFGDTTDVLVSTGMVIRDEVIIEYFVPNSNE